MSGPRWILPSEAQRRRSVLGRWCALPAGLYRVGSVAAGVVAVRLGASRVGRSVRDVLQAHCLVLHGTPHFVRPDGALQHGHSEQRVRGPRPLDEGLAETDGEPRRRPSHPLWYVLTAPMKMREAPSLSVRLEKYSAEMRRRRAAEIGSSV